MAVGHTPHQAGDNNKASRLAPPEEQQQRPAAGGAEANNNQGALATDPETARIPHDFAPKKTDLLWYRPARVVIVILTIMLLFIAFITWQIMQMPPATR